MNSNLKKWLLSLSLGCFVLMGEWLNLIAPYMEGEKAERAYFNFGSLAGLLVSLFIVTVFYRLLEYCREHTQFRFIRGVILSTYLLSVIFPLNAIRIYGFISSRFPLISVTFYKEHLPGPLLLTLMALLGVGICLFIFLKPEKGLKGIQRFGTMMVPFLILVAFQLGYVSYRTLTRVGDAKEFRSEALGDKSIEKPRVIWILFDAFDYRLAFDERPSWLELPTWDKLRKESVDPRDAQSPADYTSRSIPSLLTGINFQDQPDHQGRHLIMYPQGSDERIGFSDLPNIFTESKAKRLMTGVVGWYLPYCFDLRAELDHCVFHSRSKFDYSAKPLTAAFQILNRNFSVFGHQTIHHNAFNFSMEQSLRAIRIEALDLVFLHQPLPHEPFIYDSVERQLVRHHPRPERGYFENLALSDVMLASFLDAIDKTARAENTFVIVTSDHPYKDHPDCPSKPTRKVPLFIRTPTKVGQVVTREFPTIYTKNLISLIQDGKLRDSQDIKNWLENFKTN